MKFEKYKEYKTRGGWKAVYMGVDVSDRSVFAHYEDGVIETYCHRENDEHSGTFRNYDIIGEWKEPRVFTRWLNFYPDFGHQTREGADRLALPDRIACKQITFTEGEGLEGGE